MESEEEIMMDYKNMTQENRHRIRLYYETDIEVLSAAEEKDEMSIENNKMELRVVNMLIDDDEFEAWKEAFFKEELEKCKGQTYYTCPYMFPGLGNYETTIPEDRLEDFKAWVKSNQAFMGEVREATEEDLKTYIALHCVPQNL